MGSKRQEIDRLHQYWHFRAIEIFIKLGVLHLKRFGKPENEESNRLRWISAIRSQT